MYPARTDRRSAMLRDSAAVAARFPEKVLGGENHRYYEPGRRIRMTVEETARRSPDVWVDPESGERYVRAFHYTQPENIENILKTGLAARLGPDAKNFQNRAGVWTSMGDANPMGYDYVNNSYLGDKNYRMDPLEIRIPEEEWKSMVVDHTGKTGNDQVMVFRGSKSKPYGTANVAGEDATVVIPPEYISRYEFPKDWTRKDNIGSTLYGYNPAKEVVPINDKNFIDSLDKGIVKKAKSALGKKASNNELAQWIVDNAQDEAKKHVLDYNYHIGPLGLTSRNLKQEPVFLTRKIAPLYDMQNDARASWFMNEQFKTPYELAKATYDPPEIAKGYVARSFDEDVFDYDDKLPKTKSFLLNAAGDNAPIEFFVNDHISNLETPKKFTDKIPTKSNRTLKSTLRTVLWFLCLKPKESYPIMTRTRLLLNSWPIRTIPKNCRKREMNLLKTGKTNLARIPSTAYSATNSGARLASTAQAEESP